MFCILPIARAILHGDVMVQFYPWFKFSFLLFSGMVMYDNNMIMSLNKRKENLNQG